MENKFWIAGLVIIGILVLFSTLGESKNMETTLHEEVFGNVKNIQKEIVSVELNGTRKLVEISNSHLAKEVNCGDAICLQSQLNFVNGQLVNIDYWYYGE